MLTIDRARIRACHYSDEDKVGVPQNIMRAHCAVMRPDHLKFASYGPVPVAGHCICVIAPTSC